MATSLVLISILISTVHGRQYEVFCKYLYLLYLYICLEFTFSSVIRIKVG